MAGRRVLIYITLLLHISLVCNAQDCNTEQGEFKEPADCSTSPTTFNCTYYASWQLDTVTDKIDFKLMTLQSDPQTWIGIGFSEDQLMPNTDVVTGLVTPFGDALVQDRWSQIKSIPAVDDQQDITSTSASYQDGILTVLFSRARQSTDLADDRYSFTDTECLYLLYAAGPYIGNSTIGYHSIYRSSSTEKICIRACSVSTTTQPVTTTTSDVCSTEQGEIKEPADCSSAPESFNCDYYASWSLDTTSDIIDFTIMSQQSDISNYVGVGFSEDQRMANTDIVTGLVTPFGEVLVEDRWSSKYGRPPIDTQQDLMSTSGSYQDGILTISFSRARQSTDLADDRYSFTDTECLYLLYADGPYSGNSTIGKHTYKSASSEKICIRSCSASVPDSTTSTQPTTTTSIPTPTVIPIEEIETWIVILICGVVMGVVYMTMAVIACICKSRNAKYAKKNPVIDPEISGYQNKAMSSM